MPPLSAPRPARRPLRDRACAPSRRAADQPAHRRLGEEEHHHGGRRDEDEERQHHGDEGAVPLVRGGHPGPPVRARVGRARDRRRGDERPEHGLLLGRLPPGRLRLRVQAGLRLGLGLGFGRRLDPGRGPVRLREVQRAALEAPVPGLRGAGRAICGGAERPPSALVLRRLDLPALRPRLAPARLAAAERELPGPRLRPAGREGLGLASADRLSQRPFHPGLARDHLRRQGPGAALSLEARGDDAVDQLLAVGIEAQEPHAHARRPVEALVHRAHPDHLADAVDQPVVVAEGELEVEDRPRGRRCEGADEHPPDREVLRVLRDETLELLELQGDLALQVDPLNALGLRSVRRFRGGHGGVDYTRASAADRRPARPRFAPGGAAH